MTNEDYILMCDQTLDRLREVIVGKRGADRNIIIKKQLQMLRLRSFFVRKEKFDARQVSEAKTVSELEIRPRLGEKTSLRQQRKIAEEKAAQKEKMKIVGGRKDA